LLRLVVVLDPLHELRLMEKDLKEAQSVAEVSREVAHALLG
jgi:hypothetical protein